MKKRKKGRKFGRQKAQRKVLLLSLTESLFLKSRIKTTEARAKEVRSMADKMISKAKKGDLSSRRELLRSLSLKTVKKLIDEIAPRFEKRQGGYTRIIKLGNRKGDSAPIVFLELVD